MNRSLSVAVIAASCGLCVGFFLKSMMPPRPRDEVADFRRAMPQENGKNLFPNDDEQWAEDLVSKSGEWTSERPLCKCTLDFRVLQFGENNSWNDLNGRVFLLGESMDFITEGGHYALDFLDEDPDIMTLVRRKRGGYSDYSIARLMRQSIRQSSAGNSRE